jgi:hypothetical protein
VFATSLYFSVSEKRSRFSPTNLPFSFFSCKIKVHIFLFLSYCLKNFFLRLFQSFIEIVHFYYQERIVFQIFFFLVKFVGGSEVLPAIKKQLCFYHIPSLLCTGIQKRPHIGIYVFEVAFFAFFRCKKKQKNAKIMQRQTKSLLALWGFHRTGEVCPLLDVSKTKPKDKLFRI